MTGRILLVGDELLGGTIPDRNAAPIAAALADVGVTVDRIETVGDEAAAIAAALGRLTDGARVVVVTGGLGPTADDLTRDGIAAWLGVPLEEDPGAMATLRTRLAEHGLTDPAETVLRQAVFPRGATRLDNPAGSAPGFRATRDGCDVFSLPGVPREVEAMIGAVVDAVSSGRVSWQRTVATAGQGEVRVAAAVSAAGFRPPAGARLAYLPGPGGVRLRVIAPGGLEPASLDAAEAELRAILGDWALPCATLVESVIEVADARGFRLATAESCTAGLIGARITDVPGASSVYLGGIVAYGDRAKIDRLGVAPDVIERNGAVSEPVALAMAEGVRDAFGASLAVSVTGIAGPGGGSLDKPVGTVWIGRADGSGVSASVFRFPGGRAMVRERTVNKALEIAYRRMVESGP